MKKNYHLTFCSIVLIPIALTYGFAPDLSDAMRTNIFDFKIETVGIKNVLRAIMGLYLAIVALWITGIFKPQYWKTATISSIIFMGGLGLGRLLSFGLDGLPSTNFIFGTFAELLLATWGFYNLKKYSK